MAVLAAVDLGAQSGRVALGELDGERLLLSECHRFPNVPIQAGVSLHWDAPRLRDDVLHGLRIASRDRHVDSVAVDSWAIDFGLLDRDGNLLANPVHYRDPRRAAAQAGVFERVPPRELYERTGIQMLPINTVFELAAMAEEHDPALEAADALLLMPDLFHHWLCGSCTSEFTNATTTQMYDARNSEWAADLLERLDIPTRLLPEVVPGGTRLGPVTDAVAGDTGLTGADVVAVATHDTGSAVAAVPFEERGGVFLSVGTWSLVGVETDAPLINDGTFAANLSNEGGVAGTFRLLRNVTGLWLLEECRRTWAAQGHEFTVTELVAMAERAAALVSFVDPNAPMFLEPCDMPARLASYCLASGQPEPADVGATVRCLLESLALKHAQTVRVLADATGQEATRLHVVGGGARNELLCRWTAAASDLPVIAGPAEATLYGNLLVQAMALGEIGSLDQGRDLVRRSFIARTYEPAVDAQWGEARERFDALTDAEIRLEVGS
jgi:rhamnulokinase